MTIATGLSVIALLFSLWTLYRNSLMRASIKVALGDSVDIVQHSSGPDMTNSLQIACVFTNEGSQTGVIEKIVLVVHPEGGKRRVLPWRIFFSYKDGDMSIPKEKVHAIPILPRHTHFEGIQFSTSDEIGWKLGKCKLELLGWVNRNCNEKPNLRHSFSFSVTDQLIEKVSHQENTGPSLHTVMLDGYEVYEYTKHLDA
jgi:hypothetical protein